MTAPSRESLPSIWGRRLVSVPTVVTATVAWAASAPVWWPLLTAADSIAPLGRRGDVARSGPGARVRAAKALGAVLGLECGGVAGAAALWAKRAAGAYAHESDYIEENAALQRRWTGALFRALERIYGLRVEIDPSSAEVTAGPVLLFVRHTSTADTLLSAVLVANPHAILLRYVVKRELLWDPCLDIVGRRLPNAFVDRSGSRREAELAAVRRLGEALGEREGALIYPEGTRFSRVGRERALGKIRQAATTVEAKALADKAERLERVMPPRFGGPLALLDAAPTADVVFVEHAGFEGARSLAALWRGELIDATLHVRLRRVARQDVPTEGREAWLLDQWAEVDRWVAEKQATDGVD